MEGQQNVQLPPGTTEWNHPYHTGNSFSAPHSAQQLHNGTIATSVQPLAYTQEANGAASSGFVSSPLLPRVPLVMSQVMLCRSLWRSRSSPSLSSYNTVAFLIAPPQPSQLPVPISLLDVAVQTNPPGDVLQDVSTQTSDQQGSSFSFDVAVQTSSHGIHILSLDAAVQTTSPSTLSQLVSTQMGSRSASSFSVDMFVQTPIRCTVLNDVATQLPLKEFFIGCIFSNDPLDRQNFDR